MLDSRSFRRLHRCGLLRMNPWPLYEPQTIKISSLLYLFTFCLTLAVSRFPPTPKLTNLNKKVEAGGTHHNNTCSPPPTLFTPRVRRQTSRRCRPRLPPSESPSYSRTSSKNPQKAHGRECTVSAVYFYNVVLLFRPFPVGAQAAREGRSYSTVPCLSRGELMTSDGVVGEVLGGVLPRWSRSKGQKLTLGQPQRVCSDLPRFSNSFSDVQGGLQGGGGGGGISGVGSCLDLMHFDTDILAEG